MKYFTSYRQPKAKQDFFNFLEFVTLYVAHNSAVLVFGIPVCCFSEYLEFLPDGGATALEQQYVKNSKPFLLSLKSAPPPLRANIGKTSTCQNRGKKNLDSVKGEVVLVVELADRGMRGRCSNDSKNSLDFCPALVP